MVCTGSRIICVGFIRSMLLYPRRFINNFTNSNDMSGTLMDYHKIYLSDRNVYGELYIMPTATARLLLSNCLLNLAPGVSM